MKIFSLVGLTALAAATSVQSQGTVSSGCIVACKPIEPLLFEARAYECKISAESEKSEYIATCSVSIGTAVATTLAVGVTVAKFAYDAYEQKAIEEKEKHRDNSFGCFIY